MWADTDDYLELPVAPDASELNHIRQAQDGGGLPDIAVSATQGKFLYLLATIAKAVGPDGIVATLEYEPQHAALAQASLERGGLAEQVEILVGSALDNLPSVQGPFDLVFIDADNPNYLGWTLRLTTPASVILVDNVIRWISQEGPNADGTRDALELRGSNPRLDATALQTVGVKGWDGLAIAHPLAGIGDAPARAARFLWTCVVLWSRCYLRWARRYGQINPASLMAPVFNKEWKRITESVGQSVYEVPLAGVTHAYCIFHLPWSACTMEDEEPDVAGCKIVCPNKALTMDSVRGLQQRQQELRASKQGATDEEMTRADHLITAYEEQIADSGLPVASCNKKNGTPPDDTSS